MTETPDGPDTPLSARVSAPERLPHPAHPDVAVWRGATVDDVDAIHAVIAAADRVDHPTWVTPREDVADTFALPDVDHLADTVLGFTADGDPIAVGSVMRHPDTSATLKVHLDGAVHPRWRRRGIGGRLLAWQSERARQVLAASDLALPGEVHLYVHDGNDGAVVLAERAGMTTERWFTTMERDMSRPVPEPDVPDRVSLHAFDPMWDEAARAARNDAFRDHWGSLPTPPERWAQFTGGAFLRRDLSTLAVVEDRIVAFCLASVNEDDWVTLGVSNSYIDLIGVVRDHRGEGLAPLVISRTLRAIAAAGLERAVLDVDTASPTGANALYERLGFTPTERDRVFVSRF
ncbi:GNAT family N-acetyltransferase [Microbacterium xanthum]|uniref:GNAT family N-acetyltransferase n=1 Tax=Microbacterium xanthum TaxID=3079794 RepID=UPI002AD5A652|nr:GNAT family N-acetyltransferase [Microbacterium sp. KSW-48]MDZ8170626.1 GNAT family N-acetyltransferase [Microbacterium sp. KSW-48]